MRTAKDYPYYIVQWREGRLACPVNERFCAHIRRMYESGRIGGANTYERETSAPQEAFLIWQRQRQWNPEIYVVQRPNGPRQRVHRPHTLNVPAKEKKMDDLFNKTRCDRCGNPLPVRIMSWFTEETICMDCSKAEGKIKTVLREKGIEDAMEGCGYVPDPDKVETTH